MWATLSKLLKPCFDVNFCNDYLEKEKSKRQSRAAAASVLAPFRTQFRLLACAKIVLEEVFFLLLALSLLFYIQHLLLLLMSHSGQLVKNVLKKCHNFSKIQVFFFKKIDKTSLFKKC